MEKALVQIFADLQKNKLSHAILIDGASEEAREQTARKTAQALVCTGDVRPCGVCANCIKAAANAHADILVYTGGASAGSFKVDTVREIRRTAGILPNEADVKVFLLLGCEAMLAGAQNALLKILEEPPQYVRFILTCKASSDLLDTILSRVTVYSLSDAGSEPNDEETAEAAQKAREILQIAAGQDEAALLRACAAFEKDKLLFGKVCRSLSALSAEVLLYKAADVPAGAFAQEISSRISNRKLLQIMDAANTAFQAIQANSNANLLLAYFCAMLYADPNERT